MYHNIFQDYDCLAQIILKECITISHFTFILVIDFYSTSEIAHSTFKIAASKSPRIFYSIVVLKPAGSSFTIPASKSSIFPFR